MANVNDYINNINKLMDAADKVITDPTTTVDVALNGVGLVAAAAAIAKKTATKGGLTGVVVMGLICPPITKFSILYYLWKKFFSNKETEKERMLKEVIRKQQAIINELERKSAYSQEEIRNLKAMLEIIESCKESIQTNFAA